jgi:hypothetical protein
MLVRSVFFVLLVLALADRAAAQTSQPTAAGDRPVPLAESLHGQAKADYDAGRILFGDSDNAGALVKFQHAFDDAHDVRLLWNMAVCEKNLRHYVNVLRLLERYQREGDRIMTAPQRKEVAEVMDTVRQLISTVHLRVNEEGAAVMVDETPVGTTPLSEAVLVDLGDRHIRISKPGYKQYVISQNFAGASDVSFDIRLERDIREGQLAILAAENATISVDGNAVGTTQWQGALTAGEHAIRVSARGMRTYNKELVMEAGQSRSLYVTLEAEKSGISPLVWIGAGILVAGGIATGAYFLLKPAEQAAPQSGTWIPFTIKL